VERSSLSFHTVVVCPLLRALATPWDTSSLGKYFAQELMLRSKADKLQNKRSPRGVLLALRNAARFYQDGKIVDVAGPGKIPSYLYLG